MDFGLQANMESKVIYHQRRLSDKAVLFYRLSPEKVNLKKNLAG
jgi:hypothetical protein